MSFSGRDNRDGKRKYQWSAHNSGTKRFQGTSQSSKGEFHRGSRWDRSDQHDQGYSKSHRSSNNSWGNRERSNHNRFSHPPNNRNFNQVFDFQTSNLHKESEELVGPGSDVERMEKVLATKKRIEEALASKPSTSNNKEIHFQNSTSSEDRNKDKELHGPNLDLRLTNSDFKEIGSVASALPTEGDVEVSDLINNVSSNISTSQQRSFDSTNVNSPVNVQSSQPKQQKVGGWSMSAGSYLVPETNQSSSPRVRSDMYLQEQREEILGNVSSPMEENDLGDVPSKQPNDNENYQNDFSRVGRLYQSFLKSRLYGYTLKVRDLSQQMRPSNPLLDKSVLENKNQETFVSEDQVIELHMPSPISLKTENNLQNTLQTPERIAAEEASEFCQEFSFLLKDPNFLIPPDDLEKLGLGHLSEMNKLINEKRSGETSQIPVGSQDSYPTRNLGTMNPVIRNDMGISINTEHSQPSNSHILGQRGSIDNLNQRDTLLSNGISHYDTRSPLRSQSSPALDQTTRADILRNENSLSYQNPQVSALHNVSVEEVVEKVVKTILQPANVNPVLSLSLPPTTEPRINSSGKVNESYLREPGTNFSDSRSSPLNQMQDVSSRILRLFLIDKQIEELVSEKMKIYSELLSSQGVSQTLFHSWAQDQIQQGNVMSVISNQSNIIPELGRIITQNVQDINPPQTYNTQGNSSVEEAISELYTLKREFENPDITTPNAEVSGSFEQSIPPPDNCFLPPNKVPLEENRPKLSVRKDLLDPNLSTVNLLNTPLKITPSPLDSDINLSDSTNSVGNDQANVKREKKKKKGKKKDLVEVINLIEDTDEEISSGPSHNSRGLNSEDEVDKKDNPVGNSKIVYDLNGKTATSMTLLKVKKNFPMVLVVGCKDGFVMGYALGNPAISFSKQIHKDTVTSVYNIHKYLITGSTDMTVCLFSLKEQVATQTLSLNAPVQSMDIDINSHSKQLVVGTKAGSIYSYTIKTVHQEGDKKKVFVSLHSNNKKALTVTSSSILAVKQAKEGARPVLIVASRGEQVTVRDAVSGLLLRTFDWCDTVFCLQLYEETPLVYCGTNTKSVKVVNYTDGENSGDCMVGRSITQIVFLYSVMFAASYDGNIYVYDVEKKSLIASVMISRGIIQCLAIDEKSKVIMIASSRGDLHQIPFPPSVIKHIKKIRTEKKNNGSVNMMKP